MRQALYMPAVSAISCNPDLARKYRQLCMAGKPSKVAITAVMRKLLLLANALMGVGCGKGRKTTLRANQRLLGHLYSPLIRRCPHPRGAVWARSSGETGKPARLRLAAASPSRAVFQ